MATKAAAQVASNDQENNIEQTTVQKKSSSLPNIILAVLLVVLLCLPLIFTRLNILGAGDMLRPILKTNSVFKYILPPSGNPDDVSTMSREELLNLIDKDKATIASLQNQINVLKQISDAYTGSPDGLEKFNSDRASIEAQKAQNDADKKQLEADKTKFYEQLKNGDRPTYEDFYKRLDSATAQKLYQESMQQDKVDSQIADYVSYYSKMDPTSAAKIFEKLSVTDSNLVTNILFYMDKGKASKILQSMDSKIASGISDMLAKKTPIS